MSLAFITGISLKETRSLCPNEAKEMKQNKGNMKWLGFIYQK